MPVNPRPMLQELYETNPIPSPSSVQHCPNTYIHYLPKRPFPTTCFLSIPMLHSPLWSLTSLPFLPSSHQHTSLEASKRTNQPLPSQQCQQRYSSPPKVGRDRIQGPPSIHRRLLQHPTDQRPRVHRPEVYERLGPDPDPLQQCPVDQEGGEE